MRGDVIRTKRQGFIRVSSSPRLGIFAVLRHDIDQCMVIRISRSTCSRFLKDGNEASLFQLRLAPRPRDTPGRRPPAYLHSMRYPIPRAYSYMSVHVSPQFHPILIPLCETGPICENPRQFVPASGQSWTSLSKLGSTRTHSLLRDDQDGRITFIQTEPAFGINQTRT